MVFINLLNMAAKSFNTFPFQIQFPKKNNNGPALYAVARVSRVIVNALSNIIKHRTMSSRIKWAGHTETSKSDRKT